MFKILNEVKMMEAAGRKVFRFEVGDSDFSADPHVIEATRQALTDGHTRYVSSMGIPELREAICDHVHETHDFRPNVEQVLVLPSNSIIDFAVRCTADPGDEIIYPNPGFPTYFAVASYLGVSSVTVPLKEENDFRMDPADVLARISDRTRLVISTSPSNPTGAVMTADEAKSMAAIVKDKDLYLLSDEMYYSNVYGVSHSSPTIYDECKERTLLLNGFSKGYAMSGWRLGYVVGPSDLIAKMGLMFETVYSCLPPFVQYAGIAALNGGKSFLAQRLLRYKALRDCMAEGLNSIPGVSCKAADGAIYLFPNIRGTGMSSEEFASFVLREAGVAVVPGVYFGSAGEGHVRLCYLREESLIREACDLMRKAFEKRGISNEY